ncbi:MAG: hypothetical protein J1F16_01735 [Muribaculaceae bacterium]|nr:hypothetical protein [Muribaculaceae bacterium]
MQFKYFFISLLTLVALIATGCSHSRNIVPYEVDTDVVFRPLAPNEEENPNDYTFGKANIPGFIFDNDFTTSKEDTYVYFSNLTILDVAPAINQHLFNFIIAQLTEYGFVEPSYSFPDNEVTSLMNQGLNYKEASAAILDNFKTAFDNQVDTITSYGSPFNAYFLIYPVFLDDNYITYRESAYCYTGGAHGINITYLKTFDLKSGEELSFDDIVKPEHAGVVREEIAAHMAYSYPIYENIKTVQQYVDSLNVWLDNFNDSDNNEMITVKNFPAGDIALLKEGLGVIYQMYELTPGSDGCPIVVIPYKDIKGCLKIEM